MIKELIQANPKASIILISLIVTFFTSLVYKYASNQSRIKELKEIQKACQIKIKDEKIKGSPEKLAEIQKQMMACSTEMMKHSFKPMLFTMLPLLILIIWLRNIYTGTIISGSWIWYYIVSGIVANLIFRKIMKIY